MINDSKVCLAAFQNLLVSNYKLLVTEPNPGQKEYAVGFREDHANPDLAAFVVNELNNIAGVNGLNLQFTVNGAGFFCAAESEEELRDGIGSLSARFPVQSARSVQQ